MKLNMHATNYSTIKPGAPRIDNTTF